MSAVPPSLSNVGNVTSPPPPIPENASGTLGAQIHRCLGELIPAPSAEAGRNHVL